MLDPIRTSSLLLTKVYGGKELLEALLRLDLVAQVDLPPAPIREGAFDYLGDQPPTDVTVHPPLQEKPPLACVVDSGIQSGHPLLRNLVIDYRDFGSGEDTEQDLDGHGSAVAGIVALGDLARQMKAGSWSAHVWLLNAKVLRRAPSAPDDDFLPVFPDELRAEGLLEEAIRHFHRVRGCRVFNLSVGHLHRVYRGGRQHPWAEVVDRLARELDLIVVVPSGNFFPAIPALTGNSRAEVLEALDQQALKQDTERRILDPGTAALALTVGAHGRRDDPRQGGVRDLILAAPPGKPSFFSRCGPGVNNSAKPELSAPGGNYGVRQLAGQWRWVERDPHLGEPVPDIRRGRNPIRAVCGTSFAAAHITHACARAERVLEEYLGGPASANLIRAMVVNAADYQADTSTEAGTRKQFLKRYLPWLGFGTPDLEALLWSDRNRVTLLAEDSIQERAFHVYQVVLPEKFVKARGTRRISVTLAFDPPVRASRQDYLATRLWSDVCRGLTAEQLFEARRRYEKEEVIEGEELPKLLEKDKLDLQPASGSPPLSRSTLQHRVWSSTRGTAINKIPDGSNEATLHIFVGRRPDRFAAPEADEKQRYALVVTLYHSDKSLELYQEIQARVRQRERGRERAPARVRQRS